ncbi:molybdopterin converting factor subunit 1 [Enterovirga sp.]|uniref:molybdopterin converting factor subunit 1 n=1 Tax=Enterovirga sp. TaxID=2026350 RepID=UPI002B81C6EB|nr:molybdopterin converting factor subunit 1 [Enterovirga sp.]HMO28555.1 molybdopterin converting factor subunit 1 [Enterovirga sp.]
MRLVYFAWVRERVGLAEEEVELPPGIGTVADLVAWLRGRGENYDHAFADPAIVRAALDRVHAKPQTPVAGAREAAFFPPMTGG